MRDIFYGLSFPKDKQTKAQAKKALKDWEAWWESVKSKFDDKTNENYLYYKNIYQKAKKSWTKYL